MDGPLTEARRFAAREKSSRERRNWEALGCTGMHKRSAPCTWSRNTSSLRRWLTCGRCSKPTTRSTAWTRWRRSATTGRARRTKAAAPALGLGGAPAPQVQASGGTPHAAAAATSGSADDPNAEPARKRKNKDAIPKPKPVTANKIRHRKNENSLTKADIKYTFETHAT